MSSSQGRAAPAPATATAENMPQQHLGWFPFELNDNSLIEFSYSQKHDIIDKTKLPSSSAAGGTFLCVKLHICDIQRSYYFAEDNGEAMFEDERFTRSRALHYVPYNDGDSDDEVQKNLTRLLLDNGVPQDALTALGPMLPPFARGVTAVNVGDCVVRPFLLNVGFVDVDYYDREGFGLLERSEFELLASQATPMEEEEEEEEEEEKCAVCAIYAEFRAGFDVTRLPCLHEYRQDIFSGGL